MKPTMPSSAAVAAELGITPQSPGWRQRVAQRRHESRLHREYEATMAVWEKTEEAEAESQRVAEEKVRKAELAERLRAIGAEYLIGARIIKSQRGTIAAVFGKKASPISAAACAVLGHQPGPGNYAD